MNRRGAYLLGTWCVFVVANSLTLGLSSLVALSSAVSVAALWFIADRSTASGRQLFTLLAAMYLGIAIVNIQIESAAFIIAPLSDVVRATVVGVGLTIVVSLLMTTAMSTAASGRVEPSEPTPWGRLLLRVPLVACVYVVLYFIAGMIILPYVREYYQTSGVLTTPPLGRIALLQLLRGSIYALSLLPLFAALRGFRMKAGVLAGIALAVFGGVAPLLLPVDDVLPWAIRRVHMVEILCSNFALGMFAGWLLAKQSRTSPQLSPAVATSAH